MPAPVPDHVLRRFPRDLETVQYNPAPDVRPSSYITPKFGPQLSLAELHRGRSSLNLPIDGLTRCAVCNEPTTTRCQPCAKNGLSLFFCSPEHQKLVWKHHKQVCGPNAQPLRYPMLSDGEIADLLAHADVRLVTMGMVNKDPSETKPADSLLAEPSHTLAAGIEATWTEGMSFKDFVQVFKSPPDFLWAQRQQAAVQLLRGSLQTAKETLNGGFEVTFTQLSFWTHVARFNNIALQHWIRMSGSKVAFDPKTPEWWSCCHHAIVFLSLVWQRAEKGVNAVPVELIHRSCEGYLDSIAALSPFVDEEEISKVIGDSSPSFASFSGSSPSRSATGPSTSFVARADMRRG